MNRNIVIKMIMIISIIAVLPILGSSEWKKINTVFCRYKSTTW